MDLELLKKSIEKEIKSDVNTVDPAIDVDYCVTTLFKVLKFRPSSPIREDLDGLETSLMECLKTTCIDNQISDQSVGLFCKNFEQFVKHIYNILEEGEFIHADNLIDRSKLHALSPYLSALNKVRYRYLDQDGKEVLDEEEAAIDEGKPKLLIDNNTKLPLYKRLYSSSLSLDNYSDLKDPKLDKYANSFLIYFIKSIILKNEQSHQVPERSRIDNLTNFNTTLITIVWIIDFFKRELNKTLRKNSLLKFDMNEYISSETDRLVNHSKRFVSLELKELTTNVHNKRNGLIDEIFNSQLYRLRILGQGGSGKTTTLEHIFFSYANLWIKAQSTSKVPIYVSLANIPASETIVSHIAKKIHSNTDYVDELLETNEVILLLDGINEIVENRESKKNKLQEIAYILDEYPALSVVITDRYEFDSYQSNMFNVPTFIIQQINESQLEAFVRKSCSNEDQSLHVLKVLRSKENIQQLFLRPLLLTRAIEIIKTESDLPEKEGQIIEKFIDLLLRREKDEKKDPLLNIIAFKQLMSFAANEVWTLHNSNAPINDFGFNKILTKGSDFFGLEKFNAGYVTRIGTELEILSKNDDLIQFYHQTYFEFFCKHFLKYELS